MSQEIKNLFSTGDGRRRAGAGPMASSSSSILLSILLALALFGFLYPCSAIESPAAKGVDFEHPVLDVIPKLLSGPSVGSTSKEVLLCERVQVSGHSRLKLQSYASALRMTVVPSVSVPERLHSRINIYFHRNASLGLCECAKDDWKVLQKGLWSSDISPYDYGYLDLKLTGEVPGPITVSIDEVPQRWRFICLGLGFLVLLLAPVVSSWAPFYYSSSMVIGVLLVILILLFQGMKLLPTGRKSALYLTLYGTVVGAGTFLLHHFAMMVNAILVNFGLHEEMHNLVSVFLLIGVVLAGAALGYWIVRKFVISEDGGVDEGVAQFVKWAMRVVATTLIMQSTLDTLCALGALVLCSCVCYLITAAMSRETDFEAYTNAIDWTPPMWPSASQAITRRNSGAEFLARTTPRRGMQGSLWNRQMKRAAWSDSPVKGVISSSPSTTDARIYEDYPSVMHKTPNRRRMTTQELEDSKAYWTKHAMSDLVSSPGFSDWITDNADRIRVVSSASTEGVASDSDSTDEIITARRRRSSSRLRLFR